MNPYSAIAQRWGGGEVRRFVEELGTWHDEMAMHQRLVARLGREACSDSCPHVTGRQLWKQARELVGARADELTFLRTSAAPGLPLARE